jgi:SPP1 family predicted phage head-tail adaptor
MNVALLNVCICFQKNEVLVDEIGNHINAWNEYYSCHATIGGESGKESQIGGVVVDDSDISFTIRYCKRAEAINTMNYRILFNNELYNILTVDHMNFKKKSLKFKCQKVRR